jgi:hypothetical protein
VVSPARRRVCVEHVVREFGVSERKACAVLGQHRSTQRKAPRGSDDEAALTADTIELAKRYGRYGYRRITALLRDAGWAVNRKRVERIWRREGLKVPQRQPKRARLWLADGSCIRLRPERANHVWAYDFVEDRTRDGRKFRMLCVVDEFTREALAIRVARKLSSADVIDTLADLFIARGAPAHISVAAGEEDARPRRLADHGDASATSTLALPDEVKHWSLTTLRDRLVKIGAKIVRHGRSIAFQMAEVMVPRALFRQILAAIAALRPSPPPARC